MEIWKAVVSKIYSRWHTYMYIYEMEMNVSRKCKEIEEGWESIKWNDVKEQKKIRFLWEKSRMNVFFYGCRWLPLVAAIENGLKHKKWEINFLLLEWWYSDMCILHPSYNITNKMSEKNEAQENWDIKVITKQWNWSRKLFFRNPKSNYVVDCWFSLLCVLVLTYVSL